MNQTIAKFVHRYIKYQLNIKTKSIEVGQLESCRSRVISVTGDHFQRNLLFIVLMVS